MKIFNYITHFAQQYEAELPDISKQILYKNIDTFDDQEYQNNHSLEDKRRNLQNISNFFIKRNFNFNISKDLNQQLLANNSDCQLNVFYYLNKLGKHAKSFHINFLKKVGDESSHVNIGINDLQLWETTLPDNSQKMALEKNFTNFSYRKFSNDRVINIADILLIDLISTQNPYKALEYLDKAELNSYPCSSFKLFKKLEILDLCYKNKNKDENYYESKDETLDSLIEISEFIDKENELIQQKAYNYFEALNESKGVISSETKDSFFKGLNNIKIQPLYKSYTASYINFIQLQANTEKLIETNNNIHLQNIRKNCNSILKLKIDSNHQKLAQIITDLYKFTLH
jgi:hypothetical protein